MLKEEHIKTREGRKRWKTKNKTKQNKRIK